MDNIVIGIDAEIGPGLTKALDILEKIGAISKKDADAFRSLNASGKEFAAGQNTVQKELLETETGFKKVTEQGKKLDTTFDESGKKLSTAASNVRRDLGGVSSILSNIGSAIVGAFAVQAVINFGNESIKAFQEAEKNALLLKSAVGVNGGLQSDFEALIKQSEELQKVTIFSDDDIQRAQTAALQYGLTVDQVEKLLPVITDFASATGQDLNSALDGVLQGINGIGRGLKIYGVTIEENGTRQSRLAEITEQLTKKFDGQAEAVGKTAVGAAEKYKNELDNLQETIGGRLSPILQDLRGLFLDLAGAGVSAAESVQKFFGAGDKAADAIEKITKANAEQVENFRKQFESLSTADIDEKLDTTIRLFNEQIEKAKTETGITKSLAQQQAVQYANQAKALRELLALREQGVDTTNEEAVALARLKNISALSDAELKNILKTLNKFNDIDARDAIDKINKELEIRGKANAKAISEREAALQKLHDLEQKASDDNLSVKAAEVDKIIELEQKKQQSISDIVASAGKASGAKVEPILLEFKQTGKVDIEKTLAALRAAKFPTDEIEKFQQAVDDTSDSFTRLQNEIIQTSHLESLKTGFKDAFDFIENLADQAALDIDSKFTNKKIELVAEFKAGGQTPEGFAALMAEFAKLDKQRQKEHLDNEIKTTEAELSAAEHKNEEIERLGEGQLIDTKALTDKLAKLKNKANEDELENFADKTDAEIKLEEEKAQRIAEITGKIVDLSHQFISLVGTAVNNYYDAQADRIAENTRLTLESYDEQADALDKLHERNKIGDRQYEDSKDTLLARRKAEEKKADRELKKLKREQAEYNKALAIADAIINTAVAVTANLEFPPVAAAIAILGAAEVAVIASEPIPAFAKGVEKVKGKGTETSDEVPAKLSVGERVVTASTNRKYFPILSAIHREKFDSESLNSISRFTKEELRLFAKTDKTLLRELSTMQPVFLKHTKIPETIMMRRDLVQQLTQRVEVKHTIAKDPNRLNQHDIRWAIQEALGQGMPVSNPRTIAKAIKEEMTDPYASHRK